MIMPGVCIVLLLTINTIHAQTIGGRVISAKQEPLTPVTVVFQKGDSILVTTTTNLQGLFHLNVQLVNGQTYTLRLSLVGYHSKKISFVYPDTNQLRLVVLEEDRKTLEAITVTGKPPLLTRKSDRHIINVESSAFANGFSAAEVLQRSPGVWVDNMGNIRLKGTQPVTIMVNDVVQRLGNEELADFLRSLKSDDISRVEIIPNPPSEFEAGGSGGIIHIILKKGRKNGWSGSLNGEYWQQAGKPYFTTGATLNHQLSKLYLSGSFAYTRDLRSITEKTSITYPDLSSFDNFTDRSEKIWRYQYRFAAVYDLNAAQSVSLQSSFATTNFDQLFKSDEIYYAGQLSHGSASSAKHREFNFSGVTLNYSFKPDTSGSILKIIADLSNNIRTENSEYNKVNDDRTKQRLWRTDIPISTKVYSIQSDYTKVFKAKMLLQSGLKYASIYRNNELITEDLAGTIWVPHPGQSNHFIYRENILMLYASAEKTIQHTTIKAGLRAEETFSAGNELSSSAKFARKYFGLFPSLFLMQSLNAEKGTAITASYSRRLTRPALNELNPARIEFSNYTSVTGNPNLQPQYSNHFSLAYQFIKNHSVETYLTRTNNFIAVSANPGPNNSIDYYLENTGITTAYGIDYSSTISPLSIWTIVTDLSAYRSVYSFNNKPYRQTSFYARSLHTLTFTNIVDVDFMADYRSPYIYTNLYTYGNFSMDVGFTKKVLKAKLRLSFTDMLNTSREKEWTEEKDYTIAFYRKRPIRTVRLSFTYQFSSGKKMQAKNIDTGGQEERRRVGS
ncbi:MAG: TonB-dependent receptor [Chitinophagaceae bacterium]|nr:TonB-dependent receptor [Chitinophagaceae bacterium]